MDTEHENPTIIQDPIPAVLRDYEKINICLYHHTFLVKDETPGSEGTGICLTGFSRNVDCSSHWFPYYMIGRQPSQAPHEAYFGQTIVDVDQGWLICTDVVIDLNTLQVERDNDGNPVLYGDEVKP